MSCDFSVGMTLFSDFSDSFRPKVNLYLNLLMNNMWYAGCQLSDHILLLTMCITIGLCSPVLSSALLFALTCCRESPVLDLANNCRRIPLLQLLRVLVYILLRTHCQHPYMVIHMKLIRVTPVLYP